MTNIPHPESPADTRTQTEIDTAVRIMKAIDSSPVNWAVIWRPDFARECASLDAAEWWYLTHRLSIILDSRARIGELSAARSEELKRRQGRAADPETAAC